MEPVYQVGFWYGCQIMFVFVDSTTFVRYQTYNPERVAMLIYRDSKILIKIKPKLEYYVASLQKLPG